MEIAKMKYVVTLRVNGKVVEVWRCKTKARYMEVKKSMVEMAKKYKNSELEIRVDN